MRIAVFTSGGTFGCRAVEALAAENDIVALVRPISQPSLPRRWLGRVVRALGAKPPDPVDAWARRTGTPVLPAWRGRAEKLTAALVQRKPDLVCIAGFPWLLQPDLLALPRRGAVNLHPSLLPRHRGPNPWFWTYYHDDRETGVSVHAVTARADAGPLLDQERFILPRGLPVTSLYDETGRRGAELLRHVVTAIARGDDSRTPQDERLATRAPRVAPGTPMIPFAAWEVERVWHVLAGLWPKFLEPFVCGGRPVAYEGVGGFDRDREVEAPGTVTRASQGWDVHCRGGVVRLLERPRR